MAANLLSRYGGDFESLVEAWGAVGGATLSSSTDQAKYGARSLKIVGASGAYRGASFFETERGLTPSTAHVLSCWIYSTTAFSPSLNWSQYTSAGAFVSNQGGNFSHTGAGWEFFEFTATIGATTDYVEPFVTTEAVPPALTWYVDGLKFEPGATSTAYVRPYYTELLTDSPRGVWMLEDTADLSGNGSTLTNLNSTPSVASIMPAEPGSARDFNPGSSQSMYVLDNANLDVGDVFTVEAWVMFDAMPGSGTGFSIVNKGVNGYQLYAYNNGTRTYFGGAKADVAEIVIDDGSITLTTGVLYHVVWRKNGATNTLRVNGVNRTGTVTNATIVDTATTLHIGSRQGASEFFNGKIQGVALYPTSLSDARVDAHYAKGTSALSRVSQTRTLQYGVKARVSQTRTLLNGVAGPNPYRVGVYVGIAFGYNPYDTSPVYTDMTSRFHSWSFERGRRTVLDTIDPARLTATFHNQDRALDPSYAGSPYFPNVLPGVRIIVKIEGETVYSGFVEGWPQDWDARKNTVTITALDLFDTFNVDMIPSTVYSIQKSGARIIAGLSEIGVPSGWYAGVNTGIDDVQAHTAGEEDNWLEHFKAVARTEQGYLFQDRAGLVKFYQRHALSISPFTDVQVTLSNNPGAGEWPFEDVDDPDFSVKDIHNDVRVTREGGATTRVFDSTSITKYRKRTYQTTTLHDSTTVPGDLATWILQRDKDPKLRPDGVVLAPQGYPGMLLPIIQRDLAERVRLKVQPPGPTGIIDLEAAIQSIGMSMGEDRKLIVKWNLAPPTGSSQVWKLGTHTLGVDTYLGF